MPILVVQMGHAGRTSGATGAPGEQAYTQAVGAACARLLNGAGRPAGSVAGGWAVRLIVADPPAAQYRGDAFVAVHADGNTNPTVRGASVGHQNQPGADLAHAWRTAYIRRGFTGPWHPDNYTANLAQYYGVSTAHAQGNIRACIIECGTITNADDRALMDPDRVAYAIGDALGITTQEDNMPLSKEDLDEIEGRVFRAVCNVAIDGAASNPAGGYADQWKGALRACLTGLPVAIDATGAADLAGQVAQPLAELLLESGAAGITPEQVKAALTDVLGHAVITVQPNA